MDGKHFAACSFARLSRCVLLFHRRRDSRRVYERFLQLLLYSSSIELLFFPLPLREEEEEWGIDYAMHRMHVHERERM